MKYEQIPGIFFCHEYFGKSGNSKLFGRVIAPSHLVHNRSIWRFSVKNPLLSSPQNRLALFGTKVSLSLVTLSRRIKSFSKIGSHSYSLTEHLPVTVTSDFRETFHSPRKSDQKEPRNTFCIPGTEELLVGSPIGS